MTTVEQSSRQAWTSDDSIEHINAGSLQRIANAVEALAANYNKLRDERDYWASQADVRSQRINMLKRSNSALRGQITKLKRGGKVKLILTPKARTVPT
jgi:cell division protein FtsB